MMRIELSEIDHNDKWTSPLRILCVRRVAKSERMKLKREMRKSQGASNLVSLSDVVVADEFWKYLVASLSYEHFNSLETCSKCCLSLLRTVEREPNNFEE